MDSKTPGRNIALLLGVFVAVFSIVGSDGLAQPEVPSQRPDQVPGAAAGQAKTPSSDQAASKEIRETKENDRSREISNTKETKDATAIKETKEVRASEIKEQPPFFVGLMSAIAWPLVVLILAICILRKISFEHLKELFGVTKPLVKRIKFGGVELEFNLEALRVRGEQTKEAFSDLITRADKEYQIIAAQQEIKTHLSNAMRAALPRVLRAHGLNEHPAGLRATIHVSDILFEHYFYQFTDYFPDRGAGGPAGRRFSQRFGIIGRAWRLNKSLGRGNAVASPENAVNQLIERWGMTFEEASKSHSRQNPADLCVILRSEDEGGLQIGLLYIDSTEKNAFGKDPDEHSEEPNANTVSADLEAAEEIKILSRVLARLVILLRAGASRIKIDA